MNVESTEKYGNDERLARLHYCIINAFIFDHLRNWEGSHHGPGNQAQCRFRTNGYHGALVQIEIVYLNAFYSVAEKRQKQMPK